MIRHFCDICGVELPKNHVTTRVRGITKEGIRIEIMAGVKDLNMGDLCLECLAKAVRRIIIKVKREAGSNG